MVKILNFIIYARLYSNILINNSIFRFIWKLFSVIFVVETTWRTEKYRQVVKNQKKLHKKIKLEILLRSM